MSRKLLGKKLFEQVMKMTFYGHFVAGEDEVKILPVVRRNFQFGVKSILDYSVEMDLSREEAKSKDIKLVEPCLDFNNCRKVLLFALLLVFICCLKCNWLMFVQSPE